MTGQRVPLARECSLGTELKESDVFLDGRGFHFLDLPAIYSLIPRGKEETEAVRFLFDAAAGRTPLDVILCVADSLTIDRGLYLVSQLSDLGIPLVLAVNGMDEPVDGEETWPDRLRAELGVPIVSCEAERGAGLDGVRAALLSEADAPSIPIPLKFPEPFERETAELAGDLPHEAFPERRFSRFLARRLLLDREDRLPEMIFAEAPEVRETVHQRLELSRGRLQESGVRIPAVEAAVRWEWIRRVAANTQYAAEPARPSASDRVDHVLTHPVWGTLVFLAVMMVLFQLVFRGADPIIQLLGLGFAGLSEFLNGVMPEGVFRSLLVDGIIAGVGSVASFLPLFLLLFLFISLLEESGYIARAAYLTDRFMSRVGLSGWSFIPLLSSCGCAVPGIMATRIIENDRDRLATILVAPLMTCSARLPLYMLLIGAFIPTGPDYSYFGGLLTLQGIVLMGLYLLGIGATVCVSLVLRRTLLRGENPPFLMEMPRYRVPSWRIVGHRVLDCGVSFLRAAGTVILAASVLFWALLYFPHDEEKVEGPFRAEIERLEGRLAGVPADSPEAEFLRRKLDFVHVRIDAAYQEQSLLGRFGRFLEPVLRPLGWNWRIGCAVLASFPGREMVVAALGIMYHADEDAQYDSLGKRLSEAADPATRKRIFNIPVALSLLVFFALCAQCVATLATVRQETGKWRWPVFVFVYTTLLAYLGAFLTFQFTSTIMGL